MSQWYSIRPLRALATAAAAALAGAATAPAAAAEIFIYGDIGASWWEETVTAKSFIAELDALKVDAITVRIASIGGSVPDGLAIYNALKRHPAHVTTSVDSIAYSIASLILMAGDTREAADNALIMVHAPWTYAAGNAEELRATADVLDSYARAMATSYATATGRSVDEVLGWLTDGKDHYFTAAEALAEKLIDRTTVALPAMASGARDLDLARYRTPPQLAAALGLTVPAQPPAAASATTNTKPTVSTPAAAAASTKGQPMPQANTPAAPTQTTAATDPQAAARQEGARAEAERRAGIAAHFEVAARHTSDAAALATLRQQCEADINCSPSDASAKVLALLGKGVEPANGGGPRIDTVEDEADKFRGAAVDAILARAAVRGRDGQYVRANSANPLRGARLLDIARASLQRIGVRTEGMDQMRVVGLAFTQTASDFPVLLEQALNKTLQAAYAIQPDTWRTFCSIGSVSDFRAHNRYRVGSFGNLDLLTEAGEFKNKTIPDGERSQITALTKGNLINLSRQAIINDDMGVFSSLADGLGRAAKRTIEADVYTLLLANPTMPDTVALFHASHGNLAGTGTAPSVASFEAVGVAMGSQKDVSGNDFLDLRPAIWLGPLGLKGDANVVNNSEYDPDTNNKLQRVNKSRGLFTTIVGSPRLTGTGWYGFADPSQAPVIEVAFLDGNQEPFLDMQQGFTVDGTTWKVRLDYGVAAIDWRGAYRNPGA